jgi:Arc/MetJ-type ribon-helix-helix transcriptional regulator
MTEADPEIRSVADLQAAVTAGIESGVAEEVDLDAFLAEMHKRYLPLAK